MKIKVCGLKTPDNITATSELDIDMLSLVFHKDSPHFIGKESAINLFPNKEKKEGLQRVGVFVNAEMDYILNTVHDYQLDWVQLNGNESPGYCQELQLLWSVSSSYQAKIIKGFSIDPSFDFNQTNAYVSSCPLFLFKSPIPNQKWDWAQLDSYAGLTPFLLSSKITPKDAKQIKQLTHPQFQGIDINSNDLKDTDELKAFIATIQTQ